MTAITLTVESEDWMLDAACRGMDPDFWFPEKGSNARKARAVCATCPVRDDCLSYALRTQQEYGTWGGVSAHDRHQLGRKSRRLL